MRLALIFTLLAIPAFADNRAAFYGTWGTAKQCARAPIKDGGTVLSEPFVINEEWLIHGAIHCSLNWGPIDTLEHGLFTAATAKCGEDFARSYFLGMRLENDTLYILWDFHHKNGPLNRCPVS